MWTEFEWLSQVDFADALRRQEAAYDAVSSGNAPLGRVLGLEHPDTITLGKRGDMEADLREGFSVLRERGCDVVTADRGGQATLHSPGQLVIYPILPLRRFSLGARAYVELLEDVSQSTLSGLGIETHKRSEPGLYSEQGKLVFFGLRIRNGISLHGLSINVANDLEKFAWIRSCGRCVETFDRLQNHGYSGSTESLFSLWIQELSRELKQRGWISQAADGPLDSCHRSV